MIRILLLASLLLSPLAASAETQARVEPGERRTITAHGVCRQVTNGNGAPVMIPLSTPQEWNQGGSAFLAAPRPGMTVESCTRDIWAWEYMTGTAVLMQGGGGGPTWWAGGLEVQTRFTQYTGNPSSYLNLIPPCGPGKGGERVTIIKQDPAGMALFMEHVCNNATPVDPFSFPNGTVAASGYWTSPQITLSGIPHTRTEALVVGVVGPGWSNPNGSSTFNYDSRVLINGSPSYGGHGVPIGEIDPASPYFADFVDAYGPAVNGSGVQTGPSFAVAVRNGDQIQLRLRATRDPGVTLTYFVKIGQHITYFTLTTT